MIFIIPFESFLISACLVNVKILTTWLILLSSLWRLAEHRDDVCPQNNNNTLWSVTTALITKVTSFLLFRTCFCIIWRNVRPGLQLWRDQEVLYRSQLSQPRRMLLLFLCPETFKWVKLIKKYFGWYETTNEKHFNAFHYLGIYTQASAMIFKTNCCF